MALLLGSRFPNVEINTTQGKMKLHDYQGDSWLVFMSHPADYTPVCTTELGRAAQLNDEFAKRNTKLITLSCDTLEDHAAWEGDVISFNKLAGKLPYPIIEDNARVLAKRFGMIDPDMVDEKGLPLTARALFIVDPAKTLRLTILYPATTGRNFDEVLRVLDALQLITKKNIVTPAGWVPGEKVIVPHTANAKDYPNKIETVSVPSGKDYLRFTTV